MSVAKFYPFNGERGRLRLGLKPIEFSEWLQFESDLTSRVVQKKQLIEFEAGRVLNALPDSIAAQKEFLEILLSHLRKYHSTMYEISQESVLHKANDSRYLYSDFQSCPLELASYLVADDFCLLEPDSNDYKLVAASVCAPTWWDLPDKMGKPLSSIHAPIKNLEEKIGRMIRFFMSNLKVEDCFQRSNWFLFARPDLCIFPNSFDFNIDMSNVNLENIETKLFLRSERQTFRRLPKTKHIAFGIKVYIESIGVVKENLLIAEDLICALDTMNSEQKHGLGITFVEEPLRKYLHAVLSEHN